MISVYFYLRGRIHMAKLLPLCLIFSIVISACSPKVGELSLIPARPCKVSPGESIPLTVSGGGGADIFEWEASTGMVSPPTGLAVTYTAPDDYAGQAVITVRAKKGNEAAIASITCEIVAAPTDTPAPIITQTPTETPLPTEIPTATTAPEPVACSHPSIAGHVFPQLKDQPGQLSFFGPEGESIEVFQCQGVYDFSHSSPVAVKVDFHSSGSKFGYWGIGMPEGYDASQFVELCFWAYIEQPDQAFRLRFKDLDNAEKDVQVIVEQPGQWTEVCTEISKFSDQGVKLDQLENINLGFNQDTSSATVWVDDFELR